MKGTTAKKEAIGMAGGVLLSLVLHVLVYLALKGVGATPDLGFEFELPAEVEFGLTDETEMTASAGGSETPVLPPENAATPGAGIGSDAGVDASLDASLDAAADASSDAAIEDAARRRRDAGPRDAGRDAMRVAQGDDERTGHGDEEAGTTTLPAGAALVIRVDMARIRQSPLAPEVRDFLMAIPDWQEILAGSGIDPLNDLERLLIASPNMQRAQLMMAGRHAADDARVRAAVEALATARGVPATWRDEAGMSIAPWANRDVTPRELALIGPGQFMITREDSDDRARLIAYAESHASEGESVGDALLAMRDGETVSLDVEGARRFVRGRMTDVVPTSGRAALRELEDGRVELSAEGTFDTGADAEAAHAYWDEQREAMSHNTMVRLVGMASVLTQLELQVDGTRLTARTLLTQRQVRLILGQLRGMLTRAQETRNAPPPSTPAPAPPPTESAEPPPSPD